MASEAEVDNEEDIDPVSRLGFETADLEEERDWISCEKIASVLRDGKERVVQVRWYSSVSFCDFFCFT